MKAYYNENDTFAAAWLRELIKAKLIADGDVDDRSIADVRPADLAGYTQCHFFAGIGGWSYALRLAGWPDEREVWTASVPCQPYSVASVAHGGAKGASDDRDLWPTFFPLVQQQRPSRVFGEQVASAISWGWWDRSGLDLESEGYAAAAAVLRADPFGHQRKRLYWMADAGGAGRQGHQPIDGVSVAAQASFSEHVNAAARARRVLDGDLRGLLPCDGLSVVVERAKLHGYGNAINPHVAAQFIGAYLDICA